MDNRLANVLPVVVVFSTLYLPESAAPQGLEGVDYRDIPGVESAELRLRASALIDAVNSATEDATQEFLNQHATEIFRSQRSLMAHREVFEQAQWRMGELSLHGERLWRNQADSRFFPLVQEQSSGIWWQFDVTYDEDEESRISGFSFNPITAPAFAVEGGISDEELHLLISNTMKVVCDRDGFSGAVLVARRDEILAAEACGEASKTFNVPNTLETRFNLGSMNKMFTAVAVMQLVERGNLALDDTLDVYLEDSWLDQDIARAITIEHLLSHRSGFGSYLFSPEYLNTQGPILTVSDHRSFVSLEQPAFTPGMQFRYSNTGMIVLGAVVEAVTEQDYFDLIRESIYEPAGMVNSDSYAFNEIVVNRAEPYLFSPTDEARFTGARRSASRGTPAGGGYSTVTDLHRFGVALLGSRYVSERTLATMWVDSTGFDSGFYGYGLGFEVRQGVNGLAIGHNGSAPGVSANFEVFPESGHIIVVLSNYSNAAVPMARRLSDLVAQLDR